MIGILLVAGGALARPPAGQDCAARVAQVLKKTPLVDGHNDLLWRSAIASQQLSTINSSDTSVLPVPEGGADDRHRPPAPRRVGAVLVGAMPADMGRWPCNAEQIDIVRQMAERYPKD
jgi:membrane dipeptidase